MNILKNLLLENKFKSSSEDAKRSGAFRQTISQKNIDRLDNFYIYIASISSGAIVISVTFLGNIIDKVNKVNISWFRTNYSFLYLGWFFLFFAILFGLGRIMQHINYSHYSATHNWLISIKKLRKNEGELLTNCPDQIANPEDIDPEQNLGELDELENASNKSAKLENRAYVLTRTFEVCTRMFFVLGVLFLIAFAIVSLEVGFM